MGRIAAAVGAGVFSLGFLIGAADGAKAADITIAVINVKNDSGSVRLALYSDPEKFPKKEGVIARSFAPAVIGETIVTFANVEPGTYAIIGYHDEDDDETFDTFLRIPREDFGFSNDAVISRKGVKFEDVSFVLEASGAHITFSVKSIGEHAEGIE